MRFGSRITVMVAAIAGLLLLAPSVARVPQQQTRLEQALTCAGIYFAVADNSQDPAFLAMLLKYRQLAGLSAAEAEHRANEEGLDLVTRVEAGKLTGPQLVSGAEACSRLFQVALPRYDKRIVTPRTARRAAPVAAAPRVRATPAPVMNVAECDRADHAFTQEMLTQADKLREAGPRETDECDEYGLRCGFRRPRSEFYYALGKACDALKARQKAVQRACAGDPERVRQMTIPNELNC